VTTDEVVWEITRRSWRFGVAVLLSPSKMVNSSNVECGGYFCDEQKVLAVAVDRSEEAWLGVLLHEYSHLTQWVEQTPIWRDYRADMWDWLEGRRIKDPAAAVKSVQEVEADCERRTMRLARELEAPINLETYARSANAYIHFHNVMADKRKWYRPGVVMAERPELLAAANPTFDTDFSVTSPELRKQLEACL
jgi:hypothetical protein